MLLHVLKGPELPAHVVEDPIQDDADAVFVEGAAEFGEGGVVSQPGVHLIVVPGVIAVPGGLEERA